MTAHATDVTDRLSLRVHLLGSFVATMDDKTLPAPPYRVQELLGALLLHPHSIGALSRRSGSTMTGC